MRTDEHGFEGNLNRSLERLAVFMGELDQLDQPFCFFLAHRTTIRPLQQRGDRLTRGGAPVGTVIIGIAGPDNEPQAKRYLLFGDRNGIRARAAQWALDDLRRKLGGGL